MGLKSNVHHEKSYTKTDLFILFRSTLVREMNEKTWQKIRRMKLRVLECVNDEMLESSGFLFAPPVDTFHKLTAFYHQNNSAMEYLYHFVVRCITKLPKSVT